jgi:hypothetical protein
MVKSGFCPMVLFGICPMAVVPYSLQRNSERERSSRTARPLTHLPTRESKRGTTVQCFCIGQCERERKRERESPSFSHHAFFLLCDHAHDWTTRSTEFSAFFLGSPLAVFLCVQVGCCFHGFNPGRIPIRTATEHAY